MGEFTGCGSESAFRELVRRHMGLVYSAALRIVRDGHLAEDVTQRVFVALARSSGQLAGYPVISGWLHRTTRNIAVETVRTESRRRAREQEAAVMNEGDSGLSDAPWEEIAPHLDEAVNELGESDRDALFLRYFEGRSAADMARILGVKDEAAQKRVQRAVARLRDLLGRRGVGIGPGALATLLGANAVQAVPASVAASLSAAALTSFSSVASKSVISSFAMTTIQKSIVTAVLTGAVLTGIYQTRQASRLERQLETLRAENGPLAARVSELERENLQLSNQVRAAASAPAETRAQLSELMRLRDKASRAQADSQELARLKAKESDAREKIPSFMTNAMAAGLATAENWKKKDNAERLARMTEMLKLSEGQVQAIGTVMTNHISRQSRLALEMMTGKLSPEEVRQSRASGAQEQQDDIRALLTAEQVALLPQYEEAEDRLAAETSSRTEAQQLAQQFSLSPEQQEQLRARLLQMSSENTEGAPASASFPEQALAADKRKLEAKTRLLEPFLSAEQLETYRKTQVDRLRLQAAALKLVVPGLTADVDMPE